MFFFFILRKKKKKKKQVSRCEGSPPIMSKAIDDLFGADSILLAKYLYGHLTT